MDAFGIGSIGESAEGWDAVEGGVCAEDGFAVETAEAGDPVVVFPESPSRLGEFAIHIGSGLGDAAVEGIDLPPSEVIPRGG